MKIGELAEIVGCGEVEVFKRSYRNLVEVEKNRKVEDFNRITLECFDISKQTEGYIYLKFKVFKATRTTYYYATDKIEDNWISVAVSPDDEVWNIYYKVFDHLFGISNYADELGDHQHDSHKDLVYKLFCKSFKDSDKHMPFRLELIHPLYNSKF
jgi:hypothetical protein